MTLDLSKHVAAFLAPFAEIAIYRPFNGIPRSIKADVDRHPIDAIQGGTAPVIWLSVANNETTGIASRLLDCGKDKIDVAFHAGSNPTTRSIVRVVTEDAGMLVIEVR